MAYHLLAIDFMPVPLLRAGLQRLASRLAAGEAAPLPIARHALGQAPAALRQLSQVCHSPPHRTNEMSTTTSMLWDCIQRRLHI